MTSEQLQTFKTAIMAETDQAFVALRDANEVGQMAVWFNQPSETVIWKTSVSRDEVLGAGFDFTQVDNLTVGQARIFDWLFYDGTMDPSQAGKRAGIAEAWKGTANKVAVRDYILNICKRLATRGEALFAVGSGTSASPSAPGFAGEISNDDIVNALNS